MFMKKMMPFGHVPQFTMDMFDEVLELRKKFPKAPIFFFVEMREGTYDNTDYAIYENARVEENKYLNLILPWTDGFYIGENDFMDDLMEQVEEGNIEGTINDICLEVEDYWEPCICIYLER